jgi:tRNA-splicing endonuclease subunit Sen34
MSETPLVHWDGRRFLVWNSRHAYALRGAHRIVGSTVGALPSNKRQTQEMGLPLSLLYEEVLLLAEEGFAEVVDVSGLHPESTAGEHAIAMTVAAPSLPGSGALPAAGSHIDAPGEPNSSSTVPVGAADVGGVPAAPSNSAAGMPSPATLTALPTSGWYSIEAECNEWKQRCATLPRLAPDQLSLCAPAATRQLHARVFRELWSRGFFITCGSSFGADYLCYPGDPMRHHAHLLVHVARPGRPPKGIELACAARLANSVKKTAVLAESAGGDEVLFSPIEQQPLPLRPPLRRGVAPEMPCAPRAQKRSRAVDEAADEAADGAADDGASTNADSRGGAERRARLVEAGEKEEDEREGWEAAEDGQPGPGAQTAATPMEQERALAAGAALTGSQPQPATPMAAGSVPSVGLADQILRAPIEHGPQVPGPKPREKRAKAPWEAEEVKRGSRR